MQFDCNYAKYSLNTHLIIKVNRGITNLEIDFENNEILVNLRGESSSCCSGCQSTNYRLWSKFESSSELSEANPQFDPHSYELTKR